VGACTPAARAASLTSTRSSASYSGVSRVRCATCSPSGRQPESTSKIQQIPLQTIDGADASLGDYQGDVLLVVNVASKCGLTPQYEALEAVHERFRDKGFTVLGFPANDFGGQEPGTNEEISEFCSTTFGVQFPLFSKIAVTGEDKHPLYAELTSAMPGPRATRKASATTSGATG
jgi:glutathione peroxidase-family protein